MNLNTNVEPDIPRLVRMQNTQNTTTNNNKEIKKSLSITRGFIYIYI